MATTAREAQTISPPGAGRVTYARAFGGPTSDEGAVQQKSLAALIEQQIVPRLVLAHRSQPPVKAVGDQGSRATAWQVELLAPLTLADDASPLFAHIDALLADGAGVEVVMVELLAPAARLLGRWWEEDRCDFVQVTMGLWRLQEVVRELSRRVPAPHRAGRRALFAAIPGDQHEFGAMMVSETFLRHGWQTELLVAPKMADLLAAVARDSFDLIGLTISCDVHAERLPATIVALRAVSSNPRLQILIGGRVPNEDGGLASRCGADGTATDALEALQLAETLVDSVAHCVARA